MNCLIVSNGTIENYDFYKNILRNMDLIVCADGGAKHLINLGILPDIVVGDLDSIDDIDKEFFCSKNIDFIKFPVNKDATDTELATDIVLSQNPKSITYIGTLGSRMDHTLANINLLKKSLDKGIQAKIVNEKNEIYLIDRQIDLENNGNEFVSIIPVSSSVKGITLEGLKFSLDDIEIPFGSTLGISNKFIEKKAKIKIKEGLLLVIKSKD